MTGPIETGGKVAASIVEGFRGQPAILALVIFNLAFMGIVYFTSRDTRERQHQMIKLINENETRLQALVERCLTMPRSDAPADQSTRG